MERVTRRSRPRRGRRASGASSGSVLDPPPADFYFWRWYPVIAEYDPAEYWERVEVPVLVVQAKNDLYVPVARSTPLIDAALQRVGNADYTILVLPHDPAQLHAPSLPR